MAELIAAGQTIREVADQVFMGPKTVEAHLARVYRKLRAFLGRAGRSFGNIGSLRVQE